MVGAARARVARERARMGVINFIVFAVKSERRREDDTVGRRWGGGSAFIHHSGASYPKTDCKLSLRLTATHEWP